MVRFMADKINWIQIRIKNKRQEWNKLRLYWTKVEINVGKVIHCTSDQGKILSAQLCLAQKTQDGMNDLSKGQFCFVCFFFFRYRSTFVRMVVGGFLPFRFVVLQINVVNQTGKNVFQTPRRELKKHNTAEYFWWTLKFVKNLIKHCLFLNLINYSWVWEVFVWSKWLVEAFHQLFPQIGMYMYRI